MAGPIRIAVLANASQAKRELQQTGNEVGGLGSKMKGFAVKAGAAVAAGLAVAGAAAVKFGIDAVQSASDAQQSLGATETVFGKYAKTVIRDSNKAAMALGLSANEYRELNNVTGALLTGSGIPLKKTASLTKDLTKRAADLAATFGGTTKESIEAISSLLKGEADPIERYGISIKQSDVNARMAAKGLDNLEGSAKKQAEMQERVALLMEKSSGAAGAFARESSTLAGQQQRLGAQFENLKASIGAKALPVLTSFFEYLNGPGMSGLKGFGREAKKAFDQALSDGTGPLGPVVEHMRTNWSNLKKLWKGIQDGFGHLMDSLRRIGSKHAGMLDSLKDAFDGFQSFMRGPFGDAIKWVAEKAFQGLGKYIEGVANVVKFVGNVFLDLVPIITNVMATVIDNVSGMVAGIIGGFIDLAKAADKVPGVDMSGTIENLTKSKAALDGFGDAARENAGKIEKEFAERQWKWNLDASDLKKLDTQIRLLPKEVRTQVNTPGAVDSFTEISELKKKYDLTPDEVVTVLRMKGAKTNLYQLGVIQKQQKLTPKQMQLVLKSQGFEPTRKNIRELAAAAGKTPKVVRTWFKADTKTANRDIETTTKKAKDTTKVKGGPKLDADTKKADRSIEGVKKAALAYGRLQIGSPDFTSPTNRATGSAKSAASSGGYGIGQNVASGAAAGVRAGGSALSSAVSSIVGAAIAAGRSRAKIQSPSRETMKDGGHLADGYIIGMRKKAKGLSKAARALMADLLGSTTRNDITEQVGKRLDAQQAADLARFKKNHKGQTKAIKAFEKAQRAERRRTLADAKKQAKALAAANQRVTAVNSGNGFTVISKTSALGRRMVSLGVKNLDEAKQKLADARRAFADYAKSVADSVRASGSLSKVGDGTGFGGVAQLIEKRKALAAQAKEWQTTIAALTKAGLNKTDLDELLQMGPEAGMGTAQAILSGGKAAVKDLNAVQVDLNATANALGQSTAKTMKQAGIDTAQGLVDGLTAKAKDLTKAATKLARALVKEVKKALGIKSPSRVFKQLGGFTTEGLVIGLDEQRVKRQGQRLAQAVQKGYGSPTLPTATAAGANSSGAGGVLRIELTAQQVDQITRGRMYSADIDAYTRTGGRRGA